jgi:hypothetical protein
VLASFALRERIHKLVPMQKVTVELALLESFGMALIALTVASGSSTLTLTVSTQVHAKIAQRQTRPQLARMPKATATWFVRSEAI